MVIIGAFDPKKIATRQSYVNGLLIQSRGEVAEKVNIFTFKYSTFSFVNYTTSNAKNAQLDVENSILVLCSRDTGNHAVVHVNGMRRLQIAALQERKKQRKQRKQKQWLRQYK